MWKIMRKQVSALTLLTCATFLIYLIMYRNIPQEDDLTLHEFSKNTDNAKPFRPIVSFGPQGRLCNVVCEYVHLLHTNLTFSVHAYIHPKMHLILSKLFASFPLPVLPASDLELATENSIPYFDALKILESGVALAHHTLLTGTPCRVPLIWSIRDYWRQKLVIKPKLKVAAQARLQKLMQANVRGWPLEQTAAVVGVHVRRGDFIGLLKENYENVGLLPASYYRSAFTYYRNRFGPHVIFVVLAEPKERAWCRRNIASAFDDVFVMDDKSSGEQDFVQLSMFKHIIYSHGTFGLWAILLSDAQTVAYPDQTTDTGNKRYSHHRSLDFMKGKVPGTEFVTIVY